MFMYSHYFGKHTIIKNCLLNNRGEGNTCVYFYEQTKSNTNNQS